MLTLLTWLICKIGIYYIFKSWYKEYKQQKKDKQDNRDQKWYKTQAKLEYQSLKDELHEEIEVETLKQSEQGYKECIGKWRHIRFLENWQDELDDWEPGYEELIEKRQDAVGVEELKQWQQEFTRFNLGLIEFLLQVKTK